MIYIANRNFMACGEKVKKGEKLIEYTGCTYGCISDYGIAVTRESGGPFFEVLWEKVDLVSEK